MLEQWPDLSYHPQLMTLLLDNNRIKQLVLLGSSSSSKGPQQQHTSLQTLSVASNQLRSLMLVVAATGTARPPAGAAAAGTASVGPAAAVCGLSSYAPNLRVLRLAGNQLTDLNGLEGCRGLSHLDVGRNKLTSLQVLRLTLSNAHSLGFVHMPVY